MKDRTCKERLPERLESRLDDFDDAFLHVDGECPGDCDEYDRCYDSETAYDRIFEIPLSVETKRVVDICLSTGGPGDNLLATVDEHGEVVEIRYRFLDWFDGYTVTLRGSDYDRALRFVEYFTEGME